MPSARSSTPRTRNRELRAGSRRPGASPTTPLLLVDETATEVVAVKPAGLACELPHDPAADSLVRRLLATGFGELQLVHRLDAPACGLMLVARTLEAAAYYGREIAARRWHKWYVARVAAPPRRAERLRGPHKAYLKVEGRTSRVVRSGGKPSFLDVRAVAPTLDAPHESHVLLQLHTGRLHQIRVMLAHVGAPLVGDHRYGSKAERALYLEHVILAARAMGSKTLTVWVAPRHEDRDLWHPSLTRAVRAVEHALHRSDGIEGRSREGDPHPTTKG